MQKHENCKCAGILTVWVYKSIQDKYENILNYLSTSVLFPAHHNSDPNNTLSKTIIHKNIILIWIL